MVQKIKDILKSWSEVGIKVPFVWNAETNKPSVTLMAFYIMLILSTTSLIVLHFKTDLWLATGFTLIAWLLSYVMYRMRHLDKVKFDLDDKSLEIQGDSKEDDNK